MPSRGEAVMSTDISSTKFSTNMLMIVPPYMIGGPPAGAAALLGYLKAMGCHDFDFLDLRLWAPAFTFTPMDHAPTFRYAGVFAENFVVDVPDLPLVLELLQSHQKHHRPLIGSISSLFRRYCRERLREPEWLWSYLTRMERFLRTIFEQLPELDFAGFTVWPSNYLTTLLGAAILKERRSAPFIVAGGPQVTESRSAAMLGLKSGLFDVVVLGEGEATLLELYDRYRSERGNPADPLPGALVLDKRGEFKELGRPLLPLSKLPLPSFVEMDLDAYSPRHRTITSEISRGCINRCSFCSEWVFWRHFRTIMPQQAADRISELKSLYNFRRVAFTDSLVNGDKNQLRRFAELLIERNLGFEWSAYMRAEIDDESAELLYKAGLRNAFIGIESMDDQTLDLMKKSRTGEDNLKAVTSLLTHGIAVELGIIPGFPGDTRKRFLSTIDDLEDLMRQHPGQLSVSLAPYTLTPGQPIFGDLEAFGLTTKAWDPEYLEIAPQYYSITKNIPCTVSGNNQGVERMGQMALLEFVARKYKRLATGLQQEGSSKAEPFSIWQIPLTSSQFQLTGILEGWHLGILVSETGGLYGAILSDQELGEFRRLRYLAACEFAGTLHLDELPKSIFGEFFKKIEQNHLLAPSPLPRISRFCGLSGIEEDYRLAISPHAVARVIQSSSGERLVVANIISMRTASLSIDTMPILSHIERFECKSIELEKYIGEELRYDVNSWRLTRNELHEIGIIIAFPERDPMTQYYTAKAVRR